MEKWKPLNMPLRSWVISQALRLEQSSSAAVRTILRMFKENPKTLGHQSSALSFKSKIDLLYDLEEIDKKDYNHLIKLMEIRNQFAHNPNAVSFESLDEINPQINKYLEKIEVEDLQDDLSREDKLKSIFAELFKRTAGKLMAIEMEYKFGIEKEIKKHIDHQIVENIDNIWNSAMEKHKENGIAPNIFFMQSSNEQIESFYSDFKIAMTEFSISELDKIKGDNLKQVFKQKERPRETLVRIKKEKK